VFFYLLGFYNIFWDSILNYPCQSNCGYHYPNGPFSVDGIFGSRIINMRFSVAAIVLIYS
ncbi:hypothetical protein ACJX0J_028766, partial [Zea mays]